MKSDPVTKQGGSATEASRGRSTIDFPYMDQDDAFVVAAAVHAVNGTACDWDQLAAQLKQAATGGGFRMRLITARVFGVLDYERGVVTLTELGIRAIDPKFARAARVESFLAVPLFRAVYEKLKGSTLPPVAAIERIMEQAGVAPKQKGKARQVFMRSAKQAGFFELDADRLTIPPNSRPSGATTSASKPPPSNSADEGTLNRRRTSGGGDGGDGDDHSGIPTAILGLLNQLPPAGTPMSAKKRDALVTAFTATVGYLYPDKDEE